jgi:hypothetical protein
LSHMELLHDADAHDPSSIKHKEARRSSPRAGVASARPESTLKTVDSAEGDVTGRST